MTIFFQQCCCVLLILVGPVIGLAQTDQGNSTSRARIKASLLGNQVLVKWTIDSQYNIDFFTVEGSKDGINFDSLGTVKGASKRKKTLKYLFSVDKPPMGISYYRLRLIDYDKTFTTSEIVSVDNQVYRNVVVYNNVRNEINIQLRGDGLSEFLIHDSGGRQVRDFPPSYSNNVTLDVSMLNRGFYTLKITRMGLSETHRVIIR